MENLASEIYIDRIKNLRQRIVSVGALLLIFIITFSLLLIKELKKLEEQSNELRIVSEILECDWKTFKQLYETSFDGLDNYINEYSSPFARSTFLSELNLIRSEEECNDCGRFTLNQIEKIDYAVNKLIPYNNNLRSLLTLIENGKSFEELEADELEIVLNIYSFRSKIKEDSLKIGIEESIKIQRKLLELDKSGEYIVKRPLTREIYNYSIENRKRVFETLDVILMNFRDPLSPNLMNLKSFIKYEKTIAILKNSKYQNYLEIKTRNKHLRDHINNTFTRDLINIPIINLELTLQQFVIFGGIINLGILLYFYFMITNLKILSLNISKTMSSELSSIDKQALFFSLDYKIKSKSIFLILNTLFFSALPILSIVISIFLRRKLVLIESAQVDINFVLNNALLYTIILVLLTNVIFSLYISIKQFNLDKK